jgi:hypothetical protein
LAEITCGLVRRPDLFGLFQVVPRPGQVIMLEVPLASFHISMGDLPQHFPGSFMPQGAGLAQQTMGFLQASILERLLCLPQSNPGESEHGEISG